MPFLTNTKLGTSIIYLFASLLTEKSISDHIMIQGHRQGQNVNCKVKRTYIIFNK